MPMPGLLYWNFSPGSKGVGVMSRAMVNGSRGGFRRFQKSPCHPVSCSCGRSWSSASARPEVCEPSCRRVMRDLRESPCHCGMNFAARSSRAARPSVIATAMETPPTIALAMEAVPCGMVGPAPDVYHSQTILSLRMTSSPEVLRAARASVMSLSFLADMAWLSGEALDQSQVEELV